MKCKDIEFAEDKISIKLNILDRFMGKLKNLMLKLPYFEKICVRKVPSQDLVLMKD